MRKDLKLKEKSKKRSKADSAQKVYDWVIVEERDENFVGYDQIESETYITRYRKVENKDGEFYQVVLSNLLSTLKVVDRLVIKVFLKMQRKL
jgi:hypothetical protein